MLAIIETLWVTSAVILLAMLLVWIIGTWRRDVSLVDAFWGLGFVLVAWVSWRLHSPVTFRMWMLVGLTTVWGLRLAGFLSWRNWGHTEDRRYAAMRERHGENFWWISLFTVCGLQATLMIFISLPLQVAAVYDLPRPFGWLDGLGLALWGIGFCFEAGGDWQLARFKANPANTGRVMDRGLWRWTRHPNYFGDFCIWWGLYLIAAHAGAGWTVLSPVLMSFLLLKVSGVTLLEQTIQERRPAYADYQSRTNAFFPGPPRRSSGVG